MGDMPCECSTDSEGTCTACLLGKVATLRAELARVTEERDRLRAAL
jgi:hypothetical protein